MQKNYSNFSVRPLNRSGPYYGFTLKEDPLHLMPDGTIFHNSGKSVLEQSIVGHVSRFSDRYQLVGVDCKRVEFNLLRGVKGVKGVALDVFTAAATIDLFQKQMMKRFKFMEDSQVNNIYKIKNKEVNYYEWAGQKYQFDEMFELQVDLDEDDRNFSKLKMVYPQDVDYGLGTYRQPLIITIEEIYEGMQEGRWEGRHPQMPVIKGYNSFIDKNSITKTSGIFVPKILLFLADELNELMNSDDYKSVDTVKQALGSIARLGRAGACHLALACQRASGSTISTDLKNNIQMSVLLGGFDDGASTLMFDKDISNMSKPEIKGRGFVGTGNDIIETQTYYTQPEKDWVFDEDMLLTYNNPVFKEQCKLRNIKIEDLNTGWVKQVPLDKQDNDDSDEDEEDEEDLDLNENAKSSKDEEEDDDWDWDDDEEEKEEEDEESSKSEDPVEAKLNDISLDNLAKMFSDESKEEKSSESTIDESIVSDSISPDSTRDKVYDALNDAPVEKPKIKLTFDPTTKPKTNKIKFNRPDSDFKSDPPT